MPAQKKKSARTAGARRVSVAQRWSKAKTVCFLDTLAATSNVSAAARAAGMSKQSAYARKRDDRDFEEAWGEALETGFSELQLLLLRQSLTGSERTETVIDGTSGAVKQVKTVRSYPLAVAMRLLMAHREEVERFRMRREGMPASEEELLAHVRAEMDRVREHMGIAGGDTHPVKDGSDA